jgi:hypothetical protein
MSTVFTEEVALSLKARIPSIEKAWRDAARTYGWDEELAKAITISVTDKGYEVSYPPELEDRINNQEYGYETEPAKPALRYFKQDGGPLDEFMDEAISQSLEKYLNGSADY